jgi:hypothetical protein
MLRPQQSCPVAEQALPGSRHCSQVQVPPAQLAPVSQSAQVSPSQHADWAAQLEPTVTQLWQLPALHTRPTQQSGEVWQPWVAALHESQMQPLPPEHRLPSGAMQDRVGDPGQQLAVEVQDWSCAWQVGGTAHLPARHCSAGALQQSALALQVPPVGAQVLAASQVPLVVPGGIAQTYPVQQSLPVVQPPWSVAQGAAQKPSSHWLEQQSLATRQDAPLGAQASGTLHWNPAPST